MKFMFIIIVIVSIYFVYKFQNKKEQHIQEIRNLQKDIKLEKEADKIVQKYNDYKQNRGDKENYLQNIGYSPLPVDVQNKRKLFRRLYREAKKINDEEQMKEQLNNLYKLGLLFTASYGNRDCVKGVIGYQFDRAVDWLNNNYQIFENYNYKKNGIIHDCGIISETDWKHFSSCFGVIDKKFYLLDELKDCSANNMTKKIEFSL